jgi:hypothetical protein
MIQSKASTMSDEQQKPLPLSKTLMATIPASGAPPSGATVPPEVMIPATLVPCPLSSSALPAPLWVVFPSGQQPAPSS